MTATDNDQDLVVETVRAIASGFPPTSLTPELRWDEGLWRALVAAGMTGVGLPEEDGGSGGEFSDAVAVVRTLAAGAAAVPIAEQLLVAGPSLVAAGLKLPDLGSPVTIALCAGVRANLVDGGWTLTGTATNVPWAGVSQHVVVLADGPDGPDAPVLALVEVAASQTEADSHNLAIEPRGSVVFDATPAIAAAVLTTAQVEDLRARYALARAVQLVGALNQVLSWTVEYAGERLQFGRPLGRFQAIQTQLAQMAGEVAAVSALVDAAVLAVERDSDLELAAAAAKIRAGAAVGPVARLAHQVHGAIGYTYEHKLHHLTRRLWSWRDEAGSELAWSQVLGAGVLVDGPDDVWAILTRIV